jgi:hypothetical protein
MRGMLVAKFAMFFKFHSVRMGFFVFFAVIIALLALGAGQSNFCSHNFTSLILKILKFSHKKISLLAL